MRQRRDDNTFDGNANVGAKVIADALERRGLKVGFCTPETAHKEKPAPFLHTYLKDEVLRKMAHHLRSKRISWGKRDDSQGA